MKNTKPARIARTGFRLLAFSVLVSSASLLAQNAPPPPPPPDTHAPPALDLPDAPSTAAHMAAPIVPTGPTVVIDTTMGRLVCKLYARETPVTTANFIGLATGTKEWKDSNTGKKKRSHFYDGTTFHRVIPEFMIQGGDPEGTGAGDPGYFFQDEIDASLAFDVPGRLAMANAGPDTNGSQFFITETPVPQLDGKHTIFGQCDEHTVVLVAAIARVDKDSNDKPRTPVVMNKVTIVPEGQPMPPLPAVPASASAPAPK